MPKIKTPAECPSVLTRRDSFTVQSYNVGYVGKVVHGGTLWQPKIGRVGDYDSIIAADVNDAWYPPSPRVLAAIAEWAPRANHSPDTSCRRLIDALSAKFRVDREAVRIGAGSSDLLHHILMSSIRPGDEVLTLEPTYAEYAHVAALAGGNVQRLVLDPNAGFVPDVDEIVKAVRRRPRLCAICNPNNPTGSVILRKDLLRMVDAAGPETIVLVDEAYIDFSARESVFADVQEHSNLVVVRTFSKAYAMAGLRVGFAALGQGLRKPFDERCRPPWPVGLLGLRAAEAALDDDEFVASRVVECIQLKFQLTQDLQASTIPSCTHYFLLDLAGKVIAADNLLEKLKREGVFLRSLSGFSDRWPERFVRVTVQGATDNIRMQLLINKFLV
jgi:histidinol-phosphate aminotransferase